MDRRLDCRVEIKLPCHVYLSRGKSRCIVGMTENMSRSGILVNWHTQTLAAPPKSGDVMILEIDLPASQAFGQKCLRCQVKAVRIFAVNGGGLMVGFRIYQMRFRNFQKSGPAPSEYKEPECHADSLVM